MTSRAEAATVAAAAVIVAACAVRAAFPFAQALDPDELEHLHGAWCLAHGLWPYRDYFEHHTPWLHLALAPFLAVFGVDRDPDQAVAVVFLARAAMWAVGTVALALTGRLAALWEGVRTGWTAAALLAVTTSFAVKTAEVRPDGPAVVCLLGSWIACSRAFRSDPTAPRTRWLLAGGGFLLGAAVMFTQKALFVFPATGVLLAWWVLAGRASRTVAARAAASAFFAAALLAPIGLTLAVFAFQGAGRAFVELNFLLNARWPVRLSPVPMMERIVRLDPILVALAIGGLLRAARRLRRPGALPRGDALLVLQTIGLVAGSFVLPVPQLQYFAMALPLAAVLAAGALVAIAESGWRLAARRGAVAGPPSWPLALALVAVTTFPLLVMARGLDPPRPRLQDQLGRIRYVLAHTTPEETVMDGFTGSGVFRPHAWFYFFLHEEIRALLGAPEIGRLRAQLREGEVAPALVVFDDDLRQMHPEITSFLHENYERTPDALVWRLKDLALDGERSAGRLELGHGPTDVLVGRGWGPPEREGDRTFRRTQGRRSTLRVLLRAPADARVVVHARAEAGQGQGRLGLVVNGVPAGERALGAGWSDHAFEVPARAWRAGVNQVRLTRVPGEGTSGAAGEADEGRRTVLAVDYLLLTSYRKGG